MRGLAALSALLAAATSAFADGIPPCAPPAGVETRAFPSGLPVAIRNALAESYGDIAAPGDDFDATDIIRTHRNRRAIFVWANGSRWIIATEHGGRGYSDPVVAYELAGAKATLVIEKIAYPATVCSTAVALLNTK